MAYDLEEQEKIATLKDLWERYGTAVTIVVAAAALAGVGYNLWTGYEARQTANASAVFDQLQKAANAKNLTGVRDAAGLLLDKYGSTAYGQMGALAAARANADAGDLKTAQAQLKWATEHARDDDYRWIARLRLASVLLDQNEPAAARAALAGDPPPAFKAAFADRRGDIDFAEGKNDEARREYESAKDALGALPEEARANFNQILELKLEALASARSASVASVAPSATAGPAAGSTAGPTAAPAAAPTAPPAAAPAAQPAVQPPAAQPAPPAAAAAPNKNTKETR